MIPSNRGDIEFVSKQKLEVHVGQYATRVTCLGGAFDLSLYNKDASLTGAIAHNGFWESWVTAWHVNNIAEGDVYIDLGANAGYYSLLANYLGAHVEAFEANPKYIELLSVNGAINDLLHLSTHQYAISDSEGTVRLNLFGDLDGSASIVGAGWDDKFMTVKTKRLDQFTFPAGKMIVKMDIEGAEEMAWDGMPEILANRKPVIILEYTPGAYSENFWMKMQEYGKVSILDYEGTENLVTEKYAESLNDWCTLVVRPR